MADSHPPQGHSAFFAVIARAVVRRPILAIVSTLLLSGVFGFSAVTRLKLDNSVEAFTASESEARALLERFRDDFGRDDFFLVMVAGDVFSPRYLDRLRTLHDALADLDLDVPSLGQRKLRTKASATSAAAPAGPSAKAKPAAAIGADDFASFGDEGTDLAWGDEAGGTIVDEIISILNVRRTRAVGDGIRIGGWMEPMPAESELPALRAAMLREHTLVGQVLGEQAQHSVISIRTAFMSEEDSARVYAAVVDICNTARAPGFEPHVAGPPALGAAINEMLIGDLRRTGVVAALSMLLALLWLFRHPMGIAGPLLVVTQAALWTFGFRAMVGWSMTMLSNILPAFLVCVGIGDSVHIQSVYRDARRRGLENDDAIIHAVASTGIPVLFTTLTTMVGLLSFRFATVDAIGEMGTAGAFGVSVALLHSLVFLPAFLTFNRHSLLGAKGAGGSDRLDKMLDHARGFSADVGAASGGIRNAPRRRRALLIAIALGLGSLVGMAGLRVYHNPLSWIPEKFEVRRAFDLIDAHVGGTANVQLLITAKEGKTVKDIELMRGLEKLVEHIRAWRAPDGEQALVGNAISLLDVIKETNRALHNGDPAWYRLPDSDRALSDLLFLFENAGPDQLRRLASNDLHKTQVTIRVRWVDATSYGPFADWIQQGVDTHIGDLAVVEPTGAVYSLFNIVSSIIADLIRSFGVAFAMITLMMVLMLRNLRLGLIAMVPNLLPIMMIMGIMGFAGIPVDMSNLLIASIAIGIAVDDTIHFLHQFQSNFRRTGNVEAAINHTFQHSGRAMVSTSVILTMGFCVYVSAEMANLTRFGLLVALTVVMALLIDLYFAPALLRMAYRDRTPNAPSA